MSGKTYIGNSSGVAVPIPDILIGDENGEGVDVKKIYIGDSNNHAVKVWPNPTIPLAYQQVEYIYNTGGTQYIETNIQPNSDTTTEIVFKTTKVGIRVFGGHYYAGTTRQQNYAIATGDVGSSNHLGYYFGEDRYTYTSYTLNAWHTVRFNDPGGHMYYDGTLIYTSLDTFTAYNANLRIFGTAGGVSSEGMQLQRFRLWQNNVLTLDMYPCYRKSDYVIGVYDMVGNTFYTNSGTGIFYKGPDVD